MSNVELDRLFGVQVVVADSNQSPKSSSTLPPATTVPEFKPRPERRTQSTLRLDGQSLHRVIHCIRQQTNSFSAHELAIDACRSAFGECIQCQESDPKSFSDFAESYLNRQIIHHYERLVLTELVVKDALTNVTAPAVIGLLQNDTFIQNVQQAKELVQTALPQLFTNK